MKLMKAKMMRSGDVVEVMEWDAPISYDYTETNKSIRAKEAAAEWEGKDESNLKRARINLRRLIWTNATKYSKFVTFTYSKPEERLECIRKDWKAFQQRMTREGYKIDYVSVLEWQEEREKKLGERSLHIHAVLFTDRYIPCDFISHAWKKGFIKINALKDVKNLGAYVSKYLTKTTLAMYGSHSYLCSKGLLRPQEKRMSSHEELLTSLQELNSQGGKRLYTHDFIITSKDSEGNERQYNAGTYQQFKITK